MEFESVFTVSGAIGAMIVAMLAFIFVLNVFSAVKDANMRILEIRNIVDELKGAFERVDQEHIKNMLTGLIDVKADNAETRSKLDLLDGKVTSFVNRDSARLPRKKEDEKEPDKSLSKRDAELVELLKTHGAAVPLDEANGKALPGGQMTLFRESSISRSK